MVQKQMQRATLASSASPGVRNGRMSPESAERVREMIASRFFFYCLVFDIDLHKCEATAESETLLLDAYRARIEDLLQLRMTVEAKALFEIVRQRFPAAVPRFSAIEQEL